MQAYQTCASPMHDCEFCQELRSPLRSRFGKLYAGRLASRIVARSDNFVALPTLGSLFRGSLLVLPWDHRETMASLPSDLRAEMLSLVQRVSAVLSQFGHNVYFEHGSTQEAAGSCGIYHAHIHVVPLPTEVAPRVLLPAYTHCATSLESALQALGPSHHYLLAGSGAQVLYVDVRKLATPPGSQYFRRRLTDIFSLARPWDWRHTDTPEDDVFATLEVFGVAAPVESLSAAV